MVRLVDRGCATSISDRRDLLTKVRFPAQVLPATVIATNLINYLLSIPLVLGLGLVFREWPTWHLLLLPLVILVQLLFTTALGYLVSALNVRFRDLQFLIGNLLLVWFFLTPVLYPPTAIPERYRELALYGNPMAIVMASYQAIFYGHRVPDLGPLLAVGGVSVLFLAWTAWVFDARREEFAEYV